MDSTEEDQFDRLPDALLFVIFNKLHDAKSLTRCLSVSKRFASLIPQTDTLSFIIPHRQSTPAPTRVSFLHILIRNFIAKPLHFLHRVFGSKSHAILDSDAADDDGSCYSPNQVLKGFKEIKFLHVELPLRGGGTGSYGAGGDSLLKWKAEFGGQLKSCIILGATSLQRKKILTENKSKDTEHEQSESVLTNNELKLRVVWIISCLIAASARHYLLKQMVADCPMLQNVMLTDTSKQGKICMGEQQLLEMRNSMKSSAALESSLERTRVPDLSMKLWYVPVLELPASGYVMKGATLVVVKPVDGMVKVSSNFDSLAGAFDGDDEEEAFGEAVREMMKMKKTYVMEMNSF